MDCKGAFFVFFKYWTRITRVVVFFSTNNTKNSLPKKFKNNKNRLHQNNEVNRIIHIHFKTKHKLYFSFKTNFHKNHFFFDWKFQSKSHSNVLHSLQVLWVTILTLNEKWVNRIEKFLMVCGCGACVLVRDQVSVLVRSLTYALHARLFPST